jgi:hypothetical protein
MAYWGPKPDENDYAFGGIGAIIYLIKDRMQKEIAGILDEAYPEQGMIASLICLRLLGERFPKNIGIHFRRKDFEFVVNAFDEWVAKVGPRLPAEHRVQIIAEAKSEFALFEERILKRAK